MGGKKREKSDTGQCDRDIAQEINLRTEIVNKKTQLDKTQTVYDKLIERYESKYGPYVVRVADLAKVVPFSTLTDPDWAPMEPPQDVLPANHAGCIVCKSKNGHRFSSKGICETCWCSVYKNSNKTVECCGPLLLDQCPINYKISSGCPKCRLSEIKNKLEKKYPEYCDKIQLKEEEKPEAAKVGGMAILPGVNLADVNYEWFIKTSIPLNATTAAVFVRMMDFTTTDKRKLSNVLLRGKLADERINTVYGLEQLCAKARFFMKDKTGVHSTIFVEQEMIQWTTSSPQNASTNFYTYTASDFLVNPLLNNDARQSIQTEVSNLTMNPSYFTLPSIEAALKRRGAALFWNKTAKSDEDLQTILDTWSQPIEVTKGKKRKLDSDKVSDEKQKKFLGCIYGYFSDTGRVYPGKHHLPSVRIHGQNCLCEKCQYIEQNRKNVEKYEEQKAAGEANLEEVKLVKWYKTVLFYIEATNEAKLNEKQKEAKLEYYEGMIQFLFAYAQLKGLSMSDISLPFTDLSKDFKQTWKDVDPLNLPDIPITLLCEKLSGQNLTFEQFNLLKEFFLIFFNREFDLQYHWEHDTLRYTK